MTGKRGTHDQTSEKLTDRAMAGRIDGDRPGTPASDDVVGREASAGAGAGAAACESTGRLMAVPHNDWKAEPPGRLALRMS